VIVDDGRGLAVAYQIRRLEQDDTANPPDGTIYYANTPTVSGALAFRRK
jgi:hypothetical protein